MGEAPPPTSGEFVLALLPFPQDAKVNGIIDNIRRKHHQVDIEYHNIAFVPGKVVDISSVSEGTFF